MNMGFIKRFCAGMLAAIMLATMIPVDTFAAPVEDTFQEEAIADASTDEKVSESVENNQELVSANNEAENTEEDSLEEDAQLEGTELIEESVQNDAVIIHTITLADPDGVGTIKYVQTYGDANLEILQKNIKEANAADGKFVLENINDGANVIILKDVGEDLEVTLEGKVLESKQRGVIKAAAAGDPDVPFFGYSLGVITDDIEKGSQVTKIRERYNVVINTVRTESVQYIITPTVDELEDEDVFDDADTVVDKTLIQTAYPVDNHILVSNIPEGYNLILLALSNGDNVDKGSVVVNNTEVELKKHGVFRKHNLDGSFSESWIEGFLVTPDGGITAGIASGIVATFPVYYDVLINSATAGSMDYYIAAKEGEDYVLLEDINASEDATDKNVRHAVFEFSKTKISIPYDTYLIIRNVYDLSGNDGMFKVTGREFEKADEIATFDDYVYIDKSPILSDVESGLNIYFLLTHDVSILTKNVDTITYSIYAKSTDTKIYRSGLLYADGSPEVRSEEADETYTDYVEDEIIEDPIDPEDIPDGFDGRVDVVRIPNNYYLVLNNIQPTDECFPNKYVLYNGSERKYDYFDKLYGHVMGKISEDVPGTKYDPKKTIVECRYYTMPVTLDRDLECIHHKTEKAKIAYVDGWTKKIENKVEVYRVKPETDFSVQMTYPDSDLRGTVYARLYRIIDSSTNEREYYRDEDNNIVLFPMKLRENPKKDPTKDNIWILPSESEDPNVSSISDIATAEWTTGATDSETGDPIYVSPYERCIDITAVVTHKDKVITFPTKVKIADRYVDVDYETYDPEIDGFEEADFVLDPETEDSEIPLMKVTVPYGSDYYFNASISDTEHYKLSTISKTGQCELIPIYEDPEADELIIEGYQLKEIKSDITVNANLLVNEAGSSVSLNIVNNTSGRANFLVDEGANYINGKYVVPADGKVLKFTITEGLPYIPTVTYGGEELVYTGYKKDTTNGSRYVYNYSLLAVDLVNDSTITIDDDMAEDNVYIKVNPDHVRIIEVKSGNDIFEPVDGPIYVTDDNDKVVGLTDNYTPDRDGYIVVWYKIPDSYTATIKARAFDCCKITSATYKKAPATFDKDNILTFTVNSNLSADGSDFEIKSTATTTLKVFNDRVLLDEDGNPTYVDENGDPCDAADEGAVKLTKYEEATMVGGVYKVKKNDEGYTAYIKTGNLSKMPLKSYKDVYDKYHEINIVAKAGVVDVTNKLIVSNLNDVLSFNFYDKSIAGKNIVVSIYDNDKTVATIKFNVTPYLEGVSVQSENKETISPEYLYITNYKTTFKPANVDPEDVVTVVEYKLDGNWVPVPDGTKVDEDGKNSKLVDYKKGIITVDAGYYNLENIIEALEGAGQKNGFPEVRIKFYDRTSPNFAIDPSTKLPVDNAGVIKIKTIKLQMSALYKYNPGLKLLGSSDIALKYSVPIPKNYDNWKDYFFYHIKATYTGTEYDSNYLDVIEKDYPVGVGVADIKVAIDSITEGLGKKARNYNLDVQVICSVPEYDGDNNVTGREDIIFASSKLLTLKKQATKVPYYETKISATAKSNKIYQGQTGIMLASAKFSNKTSFLTLTAELLDKDGNVVASTNDGKLAVKGVTDVYIIDSAGLAKGNYTLVITPDESPNAAYIKAARVPVTVYQSITDNNFDIFLPSDDLYQRPNTNASMTVSAVYNDLVDPLPYTKKVTWRILKVNPDGQQEEEDEYDIRDYVTISTSGKITVSNKFKLETDEDKLYHNQFKVEASAADYPRNDEQKLVKVTKKITITNAKAEISALWLYKDDTKLNPDPDDGKYYFTSGEVNKVVIRGYDIANCSLKTSNKNIAEVDALGNLIIKGKGKVTITATALDGGNSTANVAFTIYDKDYDKLELRDADETALDAYVDVDNVNEYYNSDDRADIYKKFYVRGEGVENSESNEVTSYKLTVKKGGKLYSDGNDEYTLFPTARETILVLVDNTKSRRVIGDDPNYYYQEFVIINDFFAESSLTSAKPTLTANSITPGGLSYLKLGGARDYYEDYTVFLIYDYQSKMKNLDTIDKYDRFKQSFADDSPYIEADAEFVYSMKHRAYISTEPLKMNVDSDFFADYDQYKMNAFVYDDEGELVNVVTGLSLRTVKPPVPKYDIVGTYSLSKAKGEVDLVPIDKNCKNCLSVEAVLMNQNIDGSVTNLMDYAEIALNYEGNGFVIKMTGDPKVNQTAYGCVKYIMKDYAGNEYEGSKNIAVKFVN